MTKTRGFHNTYSRETEDDLVMCSSFVQSKAKNHTLATKTEHNKKRLLRISFIAVLGCQPATVPQCVRIACLLKLEHAISIYLSSVIEVPIKACTFTPFTFARDLKEKFSI